jgi:hypothetical protein
MLESSGPITAPTGVVRRDVVSIAWMAFLGLVAAVIGTLILPQTIAGLAPRVTGIVTAEAQEVLDDAQLAIERFGVPEADTSSGPATAPNVRVFTYRERRVRLKFVRRTIRGARSAWKLNGFLDLDRDLVVQGEEALRRLQSSWR